MEAETAVDPYPGPSKSISLTSVLMLPNTGLPRRFFPSGFPIAILCAFVFFPTCITFHVHYTPLTLIVQILPQDHVLTQSHSIVFPQWKQS